MWSRRQIPHHAEGLKLKYNAEDPAAIALSVEQLGVLLKPLASQTVTTILGFTEIAGGLLYNSAAVFPQGMVTGTYRKQHPAIRSSVYTAGAETAR